MPQAPRSPKPRMRPPSEKTIQSHKNWPGMLPELRRLDMANCSLLAVVLTGGREKKDYIVG